MEKKIIQIIPAPANLFAIYEDIREQDRGISVPVVCLALVEYNNDSECRAVEGMLTCGTYINLADDEGLISLELEPPMR